MRVQQHRVLQKRVDLEFYYLKGITMKIGFVVNETGFNSLFKASSMDKELKLSMQSIRLPNVHLSSRCFARSRPKMPVMGSSE